MVNMSKKKYNKWDLACHLAIGHNQIIQGLSETQTTSDQHDRLTDHLGDSRRFIKWVIRGEKKKGKYKKGKVIDVLIDK